MARTSIEHLQQRLPEFRGDLSKLEDLLRLDIHSSLNKIRFISEKVLRLLCERHAVEWGEGEPTLERMVGPLVARSVLSRAVAIHVRTIQSNANLGSHYQREALSNEHVAVARTALVALLRWYEKDGAGADSPVECEGPEEHGSPAPPPAGRARVEALRVGDIQDVLAWGWDGVRLLDEFIRIDYETLDSLDGVSEGHSQQWAPIFMHHPDTWRMLLTGDGSIAGYWHFAPLFDEDFEASQQGRLLDSAITIDRVRYFEFPGHYKVYICQACLRQPYRSTGSIRMLLTSMLDVIGSLAANDVFISHFSANAYTLAGHALCKSFNLKYLRPHAHSGVVYAGPVGDVLASPLGLRRPELREAYRRQGLL